MGPDTSKRKRLYDSPAYQSMLNALTKSRDTVLVVYLLESPSLVDKTESRRKDRHGNCSSGIESMTLPMRVERIILSAIVDRFNKSL